jgi:hypothetical protein
MSIDGLMDISDDTNEEEESRSSMILRRPRHLTRTRPVDIRSFLSNISKFCFCFYTPVFKTGRIMVYRLSVRFTYRALT